jgi:hypothetical protein
MPGTHVTMEDPTMINHPGHDPDFMLDCGGKSEGTGPWLERAQDDHGPVNYLLEALEALDQVESEAIGGPGCHPKSVGNTLLREIPHPLPDRLIPVTQSVRVMQQE